MLIDRAEIARLIPHAGSMCLLDGVLAWDSDRIKCVATSHQLATNPLRRNGQLGILCGVEYAAQAMALHGGLTASGILTDGQMRAGRLAAVRSLVCRVDRLDRVPDEMIVEVERLNGDAERAIYCFVVRHEDCILLQGRATVFLQTITRADRA